MRNLPYEERLSRVKLPTLEKRRERGDFTAVYGASKALGKIDRQDPFVWDDRTKRGSEKKLRRTTCMRQKSTTSNIEA